MFSHSSFVRLFATGLAVLSCFPQPAGAGEASIKPGDTIVVLHDTHLQAGKEKLAPVEAGTELTAGEVRGDWVAVSMERDGKMISGWVFRAHLVANPAMAFVRLAGGYPSDVLIDVCQEDRGSRPGKDPADRSPDPVGRSRHDGRLAFQTEH